MKVVGTRVRAADWDERTLGAVEYTGDMEMPGLLYGKILWSWPSSPPPTSRRV
jgi:hypothetical protein